MCDRPLIVNTKVRKMSYIILLPAIILFMLVYSVDAHPKCKQVYFAGYQWDLKCNIRGPGPNYYLENNVFVDEEDRLHLKITKHPEHNWTTSEVYSVQKGFGYGTYSFTLESDASKLDPYIVLGLYTWDNDSKDYYNREIDIEFSKWGNPKDPTNAQFVVQPYYVRKNIVRFKQPSSTLSLHEFTWAPDHVYFRSYDEFGIIRQWTYKGEYLMKPGNETVRMNLWLWRGHAPNNLKNQEIIISDFRFIPYSNNTENNTLD